MNTTTLVACDGCMLGYRPAEMVVLVFVNGRRELACRQCAIEGQNRDGLDGVEPYVAPVLPGQKGLFS